MPSKRRPYAPFTPPTDRPLREWVYFYVWTLYLTFVPHQQNNPTRKRITTILMLTWALITIGQAYGVAEVDEYYPWITTVVVAIVAQMWGIEQGMLNAVSKVPTIEQRERPEDPTDHRDRERPYDTDDEDDGDSGLTPDHD